MKTSVILHGLHNEFTLDQMKACIELAEKYGGSFRHVVTGIQITGIEKDDIKVAFLRHATSKIKTALDLISVSSLGFRGEALSSIASVCQVELITKTEDAITGIRYKIEGGKEVNFDMYTWENNFYCKEYIL